MDRFSRETDGVVESTEVVVVGSGPLGVAAAKVLIDAGTRVTMLEAGRRPARDRTDTLAKALVGEIPWEFRPWVYESVGDDLDLNRFAIRMVGGTSLTWGAVTPRHLENDFRMRSRWGVGRDWPIGYEQLEPYYVRAEYLMGVAGDADAPLSPPRSKPFPMPAFPMSATDERVRAAAASLGVPFGAVPVARNSIEYDGRERCTYLGVCRACPIGAMYSSDQTIARLERTPHFELRTGADVVRVEVGPTGAARRVVWCDDRGVEHAIQAERVVLAVQGVEAARLVLDSGIGNGNGLVGRGLMEHPKFYMLGKVGGATLDSHRYGFETAATSAFHDHARRGEIAGGRMMVREHAGPSPSAVALASGLWGRALKDEIREVFGHHISLGAFLEQLPYEDNRVTLSKTLRNDHGRPAARVEFSLLREYENEGYRAMRRQMERIFDALGATDVHVLMEPSVAGHYLGCHRMGADPSTSVVDSFLECHDVPNLFLATQGAFPTAGVSNPTLTGVALSMRMADHILGRA